MRLLRLISVASDLSEISLTEAIKLFAVSEHWSLIVGVRQAEAARRLQSYLPHEMNSIFVNPEWTEEWAVVTPYSGTFSEGIRI